MLADRAAMLVPDEHRLLLDAADALLFDEPEVAAERTAADRWLPGPAGGVRQALDACGAPMPSPR
ncbi:MAG TPA: hypothetical protein VGW75_10775 [Solirubrobacteraceae bacterium]|nr:hypothetical protein [Solirubrobacteraceae bacterium]